jgi:hypothetical protein
MKSRFILIPFILIFFCLNFFVSCKKAPEEPEDIQDFVHIDPATLKKGDTIMPFRFIHPKTGDWKVEIRISGDDLHDLSHKMTSRKFTATDVKLLDRIRHLKFIYGVGRLHKPSSTLRVYDDVKLYEQHGIVFEKNYLALQSTRYGIMICAHQEEFFQIMAEMY